MVSLVISLIVLVIGYEIYGRFTEKIFGPDERITPAIAKNDGVDFVPLNRHKALLIQLLNIAGTGPIFGALMGACFGPVVFLWIVLGSILGGAVHDYLSGMISERNDGASIAEMSGLYLGNKVKWIMRIFSLILLILTGSVFITSPATLLAKLTPGHLDQTFWVIVILIYYILATLLPIDKIIGKFYPIFGLILILMAVSIFIGIIVHGYYVPEVSLTDLHPDGLPVWPFMFVTVACGAISGFHSTQSPMIAKCIETEKHGRMIFYEAMIVESAIALLWAAAGVGFYGSTQVLNEALTNLGQSGTVYEIANTMLGHAGGVLAIVGVVVCPITSGDTAFRSARLILAEITGLDQQKIQNRLIITIPLLGLGAGLTMLDFNVLWRYFSWSNQTLAMIALWTSAEYLLQEGKYKYGSLIAALPGTFMSAVSMTYILMAPEGFKLSSTIAYPVGIIFALTLLAVFLSHFIKHIKNIK